MFLAGSEMWIRDWIHDWNRATLEIRDWQLFENREDRGALGKMFLAGSEMWIRDWNRATLEMRDWQLFEI